MMIYRRQGENLEIFTMEESMDFADKLRFVRDKLLMSQEMLAHELGISFGTCNRLENRKTEPSLPTRRSFMEFCDKRGIKFPDEVK
jgi:DNA-binding XRE family transcriptional regulator